MSESWPPGTASLADRLIDARVHLLDRQVLDSDGVPVTAVDDVALSEIPDRPLTPDDPAPVITSLLSGGVLATRMFGGRPPSSRLERIAWSDISRLGVAVRLRVPRDGLAVGWQERWVADHIIARIPGGRRDPE